MQETEGVSKYQLQYKQTALSAVDQQQLNRINIWRSILAKHGMIGQDAQRYGGYGFGNISHRIKQTSTEFVITGTQTGHHSQLSEQHYSIVRSANPHTNSISADGPAQPSSEALTHAAIYQSNADVNAVIHVHCPSIWQQTKTLNLPSISSDIAYGTVAMSRAVSKLVEEQQQSTNPTHIFSMLGHEDGIVAYGKSLQTIALLLISVLAEAQSLQDEV